MRTTKTSKRARIIDFHQNGTRSSRLGRGPTPETQASEKSVSDVTYLYPGPGLESYTLEDQRAHSNLGIETSTAYEYKIYAISPDSPVAEAGVQIELSHTQISEVHT